MLSTVSFRQLPYLAAAPGSQAGAAAQPAAPAPAPAQPDCFTRVKSHGKDGWNVGKKLGGYSGTISGVSFFANVGTNVALSLAPAHPALGLVGLIVGAGVGVVEERHVGIGKAIGGFFGGISGAITGGVAGAIMKD